jgi:hypothetical protein
MVGEFLGKFIQKVSPTRILGHGAVSTISPFLYLYHFHDHPG